jgi:hypothetical protein
MRFIGLLLVMVLAVACSKKGTDSSEVFGPPVLVRPENGSTHSSGITLNFDWINNGPATTYQLQVALDEEFEYLGIDEVVPEWSTFGDTTRYHAPLGTLLPNNWYWRVRSGEETGWLDWSTVYLFTCVE